MKRRTRWAIALAVGALITFLPFAFEGASEDLAKMSLDIPALLVVAVAYVVLDPKGGLSPALVVVTSVAAFAVNILAWGGLVVYVLSQMGAVANGSRDAKIR